MLKIHSTGTRSAFGGIASTKMRAPILLLTCWALACASDRDPKTPAPTTKVELKGRLQISDFEFNGPKEQAYFANGLRDSLTSDFEKIKSVEVVSSIDQNRALQDLAQRRRSGEEIDLGIETARILKSDFLCSGSITHTGKLIRIALRVSRAPDFAAVASSSVDGTPDKFFEMADKAAYLLLNRMDSKLTDAEKALLITPPTKNPQAADFYFRGLRAHSRAPKQALLFYLKALTLDPEYADGLLRAGQIAESLNLFGQAMKFYKKRLEVLEKAGQAFSLPFAVTLNNIGSVLDSAGKPQDALDLYLKSSAMRKELGQEGTTGYATTLTNVGNVYNQKGDGARALEYFFQALSVLERIGAKESISYANTLTNAGTVYRQQKRYQKAIETYEQANAIRARLKLTNTISYAINLNNMGVAHRNLKNHRKALQLFQDRLGIYEKLGLQETEGYGITSYNIGDIYYNDLKDPCNAAKSFSVSVKIGTRLKSKDLAQDKEALKVAAQSCSLRGR